MAFAHCLKRVASGGLRRPGAHGDSYPHSNTDANTDGHTDPCGSGAGFLHPSDHDRDSG